jgi:hypothetical protein
LLPFRSKAEESAVAFALPNTPPKIVILSEGTRGFIASAAVEGPAFPPIGPQKSTSNENSQSKVDDILIVCQSQK